MQIVDKTIMEADKDRDGKISFEEFTKMVENTDVSMSMTLGKFWAWIRKQAGTLPLFIISRHGRYIVYFRSKAAASFCTSCSSFEFEARSPSWSYEQAGSLSFALVPFQRHVPRALRETLRTSLTRITDQF